jgi:para-nitrobenzyl esterase
METMYRELMQEPPMDRPTHPFTMISRRRLIGAGLALPLIPFQTSARASQKIDTPGGVIVETGLGRVQGLQYEHHAVFHGIPYAQPPVDDLRWVAPQPVEPWGDAVLVAEEPGPISPGVEIPFLPNDDASEDCLYLNIWVPGMPRHGDRKPVIVFVHGGGNLFGSGSDYDASRIAAGEDVVVVTFNYRLGIFGAFGFPGLLDSGTFGLLDQVAVLEWVRDHIAAFGGDPGNVTLMGQSWGGLCVSAHLVSPMSDGLFHRAIVQSGVLLSDFPVGTMFDGIPAIPSLWITEDERNPVSTSIIDELGVENTGDVVSALRKVPTGLLNAFSGMYVPYVWGNRFLPEHPGEATLRGITHPVPVISGSNRDEGRFSIVLSVGMFGGLGEDEYMERLEEAFGDDAAAIAAEYPLDAYATGEIAWATVVTDRVWARPTLDQHRAYAAVQPTWTYEFRDREAPVGLLAASGENGSGAYHSAELGYQFEMGGEPAALAASQRHLAAVMNRYWANFARSGNPNGDGLPVWKQYRGGDVVLGLDDDGIAPVDFVDTHNLEFWADHGDIVIDE